MSELDKAVAALRKPYLISENRESVVVYRDDLTLILDRLEELEADAKPEPDTLSDLKVGDKVVTLVDVLTISEGVEGVVKDIVPDEYCIKVKFPGTKYTTGFRRSELSKVVN